MNILHLLEMRPVNISRANYGSALAAHDLEIEKAKYRALHAFPERLAGNAQSLTIPRRY